MNENAKKGARGKSLASPPKDRQIKKPAVRKGPPAYILNENPHTG